MRKHRNGTVRSDVYRLLVLSVCWLLLCLHARGDDDAAASSSSPPVPDAAGAAAPGYSPFLTPPNSRESHLASPRHPDSLLRSRLLDTSDVRHSVWAALARREETRELASWVERECERNRELMDMLNETRLWTIFAPSNSAVESYLSSFRPRHPPLSALLSHFVPNQSFVLYSSAWHDAIPLRTASVKPEVALFVCAHESESACARDVRHTHTANAPRGVHRSFLLRREVLYPNRVAADGVVHIVERVLAVGAPDANADAAAPNTSAAPPLLVEYVPESSVDAATPISVVHDTSSLPSSGVLAPPKVQAQPLAQSHPSPTGISFPSSTPPDPAAASDSTDAPKRQDEAEEHPSDLPSRQRFLVALAVVLSVLLVSLCAYHSGRLGAAWHSLRRYCCRRGCRHTDDLDFHAVADASDEQQQQQQQQPLIPENHAFTGYQAGTR